MTRSAARSTVCRRPRSRATRGTAAAVFVVAAALGVSGCGAREPGIRLVGTVQDSLSVVVVPAIGMPSVDLSAGFAPSSSGSTGTGAAGSTGTGAAGPAGGRASAPALAVTGLGTVIRVATTTVREGSRVTAGQALATLDDRIVLAQVTVARAGAATAAAQLPVLDDRIGEIDDKRADLADKDQTLVDALATITATRATMTRTKAELTSNRATAAANRTALATNRSTLLAKQATLTQLLATLPTDPSIPLPPGTPTRAAVEAQLAAVTAGIAQADAGLARLDAALAQLTSGLAQLTTGLAQLDGKAAEVRTGRATIADGRSALADARSTLVGYQELARSGAQTAGVAVQVAEQQAALAVVTAPVSGVVVASAAPGDLLAPGATLVAIRADGPARVTAWIPAEGEPLACPGDRATIHGDWMPVGADLDAAVTIVGDRADYPPSSHATDEVHLLRALPVELTTTRGSLPAGAPVDIWLAGCRAGPS